MDEDNEISGIQIVSMDITELKDSVERLRNKDVLYDEIVSNIMEIITIVDENATVGFMTPNVKKLYGWDPSELIGSTGFELAHENDRPLLTKAIGDANRNSEKKVRLN